jgi:magnesium chelatase subunit D
VLAIAVGWIIAIMILVTIVIDAIEFMVCQYLLYQALKMAGKEKSTVPVIIVISDGRGNVFMEGNLENDVKLLNSMVNDVNLVFVNAESRGRSIGILEDISSTFNSPHFYLEEII